MTEDTYQGQPRNHECMPYHDYEIDLREIFGAIWHRRKFICTGVALFVLIACAYAFSQPNIYRMKALVAPTLISRAPDGEVKFTNSLVNYKGQIDAGSYTGRIMSFLEEQYEDQSYSSGNLKVSIPKNSSALMISYDSENSNYGVAFLRHLIVLIKKEDLGISKAYAESLNSDTLLNKEYVEEYTEQIRIIEKQLNSLNKSKLEVEEQARVVFETAKSYNVIDETNSSSSLTDDNISKILLYTNRTIQNRQLLSDLTKESNTISDQINSLIRNRQQILEVSRSLKGKIDDDMRSIENIQPFQEIIPVMVNGGRVGPKRGLIVGMSFVCGLFFMIFSVFVVSFIKPSE